jgi:hypothetical protein
MVWKTWKGAPAYTAHLMHRWRSTSLLRVVAITILLWTAIDLANASACSLDNESLPLDACVDDRGGTGVPWHGSSPRNRSVEHERLEPQSASIDQQIENLADAIAIGGNVPALAQRLSKTHQRARN